jgi:AcrR family transcriptional regulator
MSDRRAMSKQSHESDAATARARILDAAFAVFMARGYADASTLEIATRARVSKRELYTLVGNKQAILVACITERVKRMRLPMGTPVSHDRETLARILSRFGARFLREVSDPDVIGVFRLAIAEAERTPEIARALDSIGREAGRAAVSEILARARSSGQLDGAPREMAEQFIALLWGGLMVSLLLRVADQPSAREVARRARNAAAAFLRLYPAPN